MRIVDFNVSEDKYMDWYIHKGNLATPVESVLFRVNFDSEITHKEAIALATDMLAARCPEWFVSGGYKWTLDLDKLKANFKIFGDLEWLNGKITVEPEFKRQKVFGRLQSRLIVALMPEDLSRELFQKHVSGSPEELLPSLSKFRKSYPNPTKNAFIIMRLSKTRAHTAILRTIKSTLSKYSLHGLRSDDKEYSDDLLTNIRTYMHGCGFGIAVFERLLEEEFNPNISLEVGYMTALGKPVLLLKDKTLRHLHTDIVGKLYRDFDPQDPKGTIPRQIESWLRDKGLI